MTANNFYNTSVDTYYLFGKLYFFPAKNDAIIFKWIFMHMSTLDIE